MARTQVDNAHPHGHEHVQLVAPGKGKVRTVESLLNRLQVLHHRAENNSRDHHEERGGHALARDIANHDAQVVVVYLEEVIEVATDFLRRQHERDELVAVVVAALFHLVFGKHRQLDVPREIKFTFDSAQALLRVDAFLD